MDKDIRIEIKHIHNTFPFWGQVLRGVFLRYIFENKCSVYDAYIFSSMSGMFCRHN